jgi:hypothetical protein
MGYQHRLYETKCGNCGVEWLLFPMSWEPGTLLPYKFRCESCGARNTTEAPALFPKIPRELYCGHEKHRQIHVYPYPPTTGQTSWALPYSIRSFVHQASRHLGQCDYAWNGSNDVMGEPAHIDLCNFGGGYGDESTPCHLLSGFTRGESTCPLWQELKEYCQTEVEQRFLWAYLHLAKGRNFPMLMPQARIGIAERRRPDFVAFVPLQYLKYNWYAIELDGAHQEIHRTSDEARDADLASEGYEIISLRPTEKGYFEEVRKLVERFAVEMTDAERNRSELATSVDNRACIAPAPILDEDIPF